MRINFLDIIRKASSGTFKAPAISNFIVKIGSPHVKRNSTSKRDITLVVHDTNTGYKQKVGFSIKSKLGGASTLFNASVASNIRYKIEGLERLDTQVLRYLHTLAPKKLFKELRKNHCQVHFDSVIDSNFKSNLQMVDSNLPIILSEILQLYYSGYTKNIKELTEKVAQINPCRFQHNKNYPFYEHKVKGFLTACALGMTSKKKLGMEILMYREDI